MSYCRFSDCDVYVYDDSEGGITIMTIRDEIYRAKTRTEAVDKLIELKHAGLDILPEVIEQLQEDRTAIGETAGIEPVERGDDDQPL